ncbi:MAG: NUDIX hydrolase [Chitinophagales bacterium]|nr:NUDIX hydrolase [Chitinophagales bacterium]
MQQLTRFNVRVYGLLINELQQVLVADEVFANGIRATKFPGGGLELGEGLRECLAREFKEETGINVTVAEHFYTTDFFQPSFLDNNSQIISVYYLCQSAEWQNIKTSDKKFDFEVVPGKEAESFRWVPVKDLQHETTITLPIDKVVVDLLSGLSAHSK